MAEQAQKTAHASRGRAAPDTYAIVETGGKQYRAEQGATLLVERLPDDEGAKVNLRAVMYRADGKVVLEAKELEKVKVEATVAEHLRGPKVRIVKHRPKKGYRRRAGHRQGLTKLEVTEVKMLTRRPAAKKPAAKKPAGKASTTAEEPAGGTRKTSNTRSSTRTKKKED
jgi:large subunit ribosomal protein L21